MTPAASFVSVLACALGFRDERGELLSKGAGDSLSNVDGRFALAALQETDVGVMDAGEIAARPLFSLLASFSGAFLPTSSELAIRCALPCALNRVGRSMDIQRLGPNLDRLPRDATLVSTRAQRRAPWHPRRALSSARSASSIRELGMQRLGWSDTD